MNPHFTLRSLRISFLPLGAALFLVPLAHSSLVGRPQQQQSSQTQPPQNSQPQLQQSSPPEKPASKPKKVWTNEDVVSLRTPADTYQAEKEAHAAAEAEAVAREASQAKLIKDAGLTVKLPATAEETQLMIKTKQGEISEEQAGIERMNNELPSTPEDQKAAVKKEIDRVTADLQKDRVELEVLQNHLQKLKKTTANQSSAVPPQPLSSN
jgi:hypothetical protein